MYSTFSSIPAQSVRTGFSFFSPQFCKMLNFFFSDTNQLAEQRSGIDFNALFKHFQQVQRNHHEYRGNQRKRNFSVTDRHAGNI